MTRLPIVTARTMERVLLHLGFAQACAKGKSRVLSPRRRPYNHVPHQAAICLAH